MRKIFLTLFYSGYSPVAPGSVGSLVALIIGYYIFNILSLSNFILLTILLSIIAVREINIYEKETNIHDDKKIVIDELVGLWLTLAIAGSNKEYLEFIFVVGFLSFRFFDIYKPSVIGKIDKNVQGGLGVVLDDLVAGFFGGILTVILLKIYILLKGLI